MLVLADLGGFFLKENIIFWRPTTESAILPLVGSIGVKRQPNIRQTKNAGSKNSPVGGGGGVIDHIGGLRGVRGTPPSSYYFHFMQFLGKCGKIVCWRHPPPPTQGLTPTPRRNPGFATGSVVNMLRLCQNFRNKPSTFSRDVWSSEHMLCCHWGAMHNSL